MKKLSLLLIVSVLLSACKKEPEPAPVPRIKKVIQLNVMDTKFIQLDDGSRYGMGENLYNRLVTRLENSKRFVVIVNEPWGKDGMVRLNQKNLIGTNKTKSEIIYDPSDRLHFEFAPIAAADFRAEVQGLTFTHGSRGVKRFAGYSSDFTTPWNNGSFENLNEFPPRSLDFARSWFGNSFDPIGSDSNNTISGVDAGEQGEMNLIIANMHYRRDKFLASARVHTELRLLTENTVTDRNIDANGKGFLFALGVGWNGISLEFGVKRNDALKQTFDYEVDGIAKEIQEQLEKVPFRTKLEMYGEQGMILNAGKREGIQVGDLFSHRAGEGITTLKVVESFQIGSRVELVSGKTDNLKVGDILVLDEKTNSNSKSSSQQSTIAAKKDLTNNRSLASTEEVHTVENKSITLDPPEFSSPDGDALYGLNSKNSILLPWLLARWAQYDQEIQTINNIPARNNIHGKANSQWNSSMIHASEAWTKSGTMGAGVKVAIIDSGVDYNHKNLYKAFPRNYAGWDFMSHEARPFDDNSHGTAIAGIIAAQGIANESVGIAPDVELLAYKIFNPYGETTSAALYGAFDRAIKDGAKIIVAAWSTQNETKSMAAALKLAEEKGVLVITGAGDRGDDLNQNMYFPASANAQNNLLTVAALNQQGALSTIQGRYSNFGVGVVDIAAPGEKISVLAPRSEYLLRSGTDLAAAHVAGVAALIAAKYPEASAAELKFKILHSACEQKEELRAQITNGCALNAAAAF